MPNAELICVCRSSHLTNDAVQEKFEHYGTFEDSNKLSMEAFQELFADQVIRCRLHKIHLARAQYEKPFSEYDTYVQKYEAFSLIGIEVISCPPHLYLML